MILPIYSIFLYSLYLVNVCKYMYEAEGGVTDPTHPVPV